MKALEKVVIPLFCGKLCSFNIFEGLVDGVIAVDVRHKCSLVSLRKFVAGINFLDVMNFCILSRVNLLTMFRSEEGGLAAVLL